MRSRDGKKSERHGENERERKNEKGWEREREDPGSECGARFTLKPRATATPERFRLSIALVLKHPVSICRSSRWYAGWLVVAHPRARSGPSCVLCGSFYSPLVDGRDDCHVGNLWSLQMPFEICPIGWATVDTCHASFATFTSACGRLIIRPIIFYMTR